MRVLTTCLALAHPECKRSGRHLPPADWPPQPQKWAVARVGAAPSGQNVFMADRAPLSPADWARAVLNVLNLSTPLGLLIALAARARISRGAAGLILAEHYRLAIPKAGAFTVGNVVLLPGGSLADLTERFPDVLGHEAAHAWQYAACLGLPFFPLYLLASGWSWLRTGDVAADNTFERLAGLTAGGYAELPLNNAGLRRIVSFRRAD